MNHPSASRRTRLAPLATAVLLSVTLSGCSIVNVQTWFSLRGYSVSRADALAIANEVNKTEPDDCDINYSDCLPTNVAEVHCENEPGNGPAIFGPIYVYDWDHFELDPDGDGIACDANYDPIGEVTVLRQRLDTLTVAGIAADPDSPDPIAIHVQAIDLDSGASRWATDIANRPSQPSDYYDGEIPANRGFEMSIPAGVGVQQVCVYMINVGPGENTLITCEMTEVLAPVTTTVGSVEVTALIESYEPYFEGESFRLLISGYVFTSDGSPLPSMVLTNEFSRAFDPIAGFPEQLVPNEARPDVAARFGVPLVSGFTYTTNLETTLGRLAWSACLSGRSPGGPPSFDLACRELSLLGL